MLTRISLVLAFALTFTFAVFPSVGRAQQENDDPNWRERELERRLKETEKLQKQLDRLNEELEENRREAEKNNRLLEKALGRSRSSLNSRFLNIYDYGPIHWYRGLTYGRKSGQGKGYMHLL